MHTLAQVLKYRNEEDTLGTETLGTKTLGTKTLGWLPPFSSLLPARLLAFLVFLTPFFFRLKVRRGATPARGRSVRTQRRDLDDTV